MDARPVGMFDSGVGGLSVLRSFRELAPAEDVIYYADTAYFPYGPRPAAEVRKRSFAIVHRLMERGVKLVVVACNTASAAAVADLRAAFPIPFVAMVPGLKPAALSSPNRCVAILATPGTLDGALYGRVVEEFAAGTRVMNVPGHGLAELVEGGDWDGPAAQAAVREALDRAVADGVDTVVLGCTHYHFLGPAIAAAYPGVSLIDTSEPVARRAVQVLRMERLEAPAGRRGTLDIVVSGDHHEAFVAVAARLGFRPDPVGGRV